ncbi:rhodanese-like domain-containing protein, partial [Escherichia coli]|uniref:rhodanese-like domain-containing protein n=1 Tax=Escherichia coli TaxID=562 RepID=UPI0032E41332
LHKPTDDPVLDVRRREEFERSHNAVAVNIPVNELMGRMDEVPAARLWVHCASGYRSAVAASLLQRDGHDVVHVDANFRELKKSGLPMA